MAFALFVVNSTNAIESEFPDLVPLLQYDAFKNLGETMSFEIGALNDGNIPSKVTKIRFRIDFDSQQGSLNPIEKPDREELLELPILTAKERKFLISQAWVVTAGTHNAEVCIIEEEPDTVNYTHINDCYRNVMQFPRPPENDSLPNHHISKIWGEARFPDVNPKKLDIVVVGDNFPIPEMIQNVKTNYERDLLTVEPFRSRSQDIQFHVLPKVFDLQCQNDPDPKVSGKPIQVCKNPKNLLQELTAAKIPFDKIVIAALALHGGHAQRDGAMAYVPTLQQNSNTIFAHELAHTLGLVDEYVISDTGDQSDYQKTMGSASSLVNCSAVSTCSDWKNISGAQCIAGCALQSWYRSSEKSIMNTIAPLGEFNAVSQKHLNTMLDLYSKDTIAPEVSVTSPKQGEKIMISSSNQGNTIATVTFVTASAKDNNALGRAELYINGKLTSITSLANSEFYGIQKETVLTFSPDFTGIALEQNFTAKIKVFDLAGNASESAPVTFFVTSSLRDQYEGLRTFIKNNPPPASPLKDPAKPAQWEIDFKKTQEESQKKLQEMAKPPKLTPEQLKKFEEEEKRLRTPPPPPPGMTKQKNPPPPPGMDEKTWKKILKQKERQQKLEQKREEKKKAKRKKLLEERNTKQKAKAK